MVIIFCINNYATIKIILILYKGQKYLLNIFFKFYTSFASDLYIRLDTSIYNKL